MEFSSSSESGKGYSKNDRQCTQEGRDTPPREETEEDFRKKRRQNEHESGRQFMDGEGFAPVLGVVFTRAQTDYVGSLALMSAFAIGHCGVIVLAGTMSQKVQGYLNWSEKSKAVKLIKSTCGILVIIGGIYLLTK